MGFNIEKQDILIKKKVKCDFYWNKYVSKYHYLNNVRLFHKYWKILTRLEYYILHNFTSDNIRMISSDIGLAQIFGNIAC